MKKLKYGTDLQLIIRITRTIVRFCYAIEMIQAFIKLRFVQIFRTTQGFGLIRIIVLIVSSVLSVTGLFLQTRKTPSIQI
jgi:hypothetical protein